MAVVVVVVVVVVVAVVLVASRSFHCKLAEVVVAGKRQQQ